MKKRKSRKVFALGLAGILSLALCKEPRARALRMDRAEQKTLLFSLIRELCGREIEDPYTVFAHDLLLLISCPLCGEHLFDEGSVLLAPACEREGEKLYRCRRCGETKTEPIPALGHKWSDWVEVMPADFTDEGELARFCVREHCTAIERQILPKLTPSPMPSPTPMPAFLERGTILPEISGGIYRVLSPKEAVFVKPARALASFVIPDVISCGDTVFSVTGIAPEAFASRTDLTDVYIGANVVYIGDHAFMACSHLERIFVLGSEIRQVGRAAFLGAGSDVEKITLTLPASCEKALLRAFREAGLRRNTDVQTS